ncbi:MAG: serine/threonine-protein kinase [Gemmatimonadaceae bacterium]
MASKVLIRPQQQTASSLLTTPRGSRRDIPMDLLREASQRLGKVALMGGSLWILATLLFHLTWVPLHPSEPWVGLRGTDAVAVVAGLVSLGLWAYTRRADRDSRFVLNLGLAYLIASCLAVGLVMHWEGSTPDALRLTISWVGVSILIFSAVLPIEPRKMLVVGVLAALMNPLAMAITGVTSETVLGAFRAGLLMHYPDLLLAGVGATISGVVTRMSRHVSKAREMGSYRLGDLIRKGGMGEVYRATHRMLARPAAIKLIRAEMLMAADAGSADLAVVRFHREAEAAASLRSPHTVELFDFGITEDQTLYFVMELLEGMDLDSMVKAHGPLPARRVIHILRQACDSLEEAHSKGLVHRDIKPANIHLGKVGIRNDFVKVLDFGLVKSLDRKAIDVTLATEVGQTAGTPAYMAPEMALSEDVDGRADIYALGCVAYFLLTGKLVFEAETSFQMIAKHLRNAPVPPSLRGGVDIPRQLEELILSCLEKSPDLRPASAATLDGILASLRLGDWTDEEARQWWQSIETAADAMSSATTRFIELSPSLAVRAGAGAMAQSGLD